MKVAVCLISFFLVLVVVFAGCAPSRVAPGAAGDVAVRTAQIWVTPVSGKPGAKPLTINGAGFIRGEKVKLILVTEFITMHLAPKESGGIVTANEYGAFVLRSDGFPMGVEEGVYALKAEGDKGSVATAPIEFLKSGREK